MTKSRFLIASLFILFTNCIFAQKQNSLYLKYIETYSPVAVEHMKTYKIPASITLAQGLLESGAGQSQLARKSNNHFGIKCGSDWRGNTVRHHDDARNECFRAYKNPKESYKDHALFLTNRPRYASLFKLKTTDYKGWAHGLKKAGYATDPSYANRLIQIIENYELYKYDNKGRTTSNNTQKEVTFSHDVYITNGLLYVIAGRGDTFKSIAKEFNTRQSKLIRYNDLHSGYTLKEGEIVYLRAKKKKADKKYPYHIVREDESMHTISQRYGVQLKSLYKMNKKDPMEYYPQVGDRLRLR